MIFVSRSRALMDISPTRNVGTVGSDITYPFPERHSELESDYVQSTSHPPGPPRGEAPVSPTEDPPFGRQS
jgi:hypothetical protein